MSKKKWAAVIGVILLTGMVAGAVLLFMEPSQEEQNIINAVNSQKKVIDHQGHVKKVSIGEKRHDGVMPFEAQILNEAGVPIGTVKGQRIEGFGTAELHYQFDGEPPEPEHQHRGRRHRDGQGGSPGQQGSKDQKGQDRPPNPDAPK